MEQEEKKSTSRSVFPNADLVTYVSDVEGHWHYFCNFVELSHGISFASSGNHREARTSEDLALVLKDNWHFVFGGDSCDKGPGTLRFLEAMVRLKRKYPDRVHLLLGNRDINKIRWTSELAQSEIDRIEEVPGAYWVPEKGRTTHLQFLRRLAAQEEGVPEESLAPGASDERVKKRNTKTNKMIYMLKCDMGSDGEFDFRRIELAHLRGVAPEMVTDDECIQSYEDSVAPGGWMRAYIEEAELAVRLADSIYVHGQIIGNCFPQGQVRGADSANTAWSIGVVPGEAEPVNDINEWLAKLNAWARQQVAEWVKHPVWHTPPKEPTYEGWTGRGGHEFIAYGTPASRDPTVVYCRYLTEKAMPLQYPSQLVSHLQSQGIRFVVVGHTPHGNAPTIIRSGAVCTIMADTSYSEMGGNRAFKADNRGEAACDIFFEKGIVGVKGLTEQDQVIDYYVSPLGNLPEVPRCLFDTLDPYVGQVQDPDDQGRQFFVKAKLVRLPVEEGGAEEAYLMTSIQGYKYEYATLETEQVAQALKGSRLENAAGRHIVLRQAPFACGQLFGHSFEGDGSVELVDYLFQRIDKDGDGMVTKYELLAACTDKELRYAIRTSFPGLDVSKIMLKLDKDGDQLISPEEFRIQLLSHASSLKAKDELGAVFFEVISKNVYDAAGGCTEFPAGMRPIGLQTTEALTAADVLIDMVNLSRWATEEWHCEIHAQSLARTEMLTNVMKALPDVLAGNALRGHLSPLQRLTVSPEMKATTGVPESAAFFSWCYPFIADWGMVFAADGVDPFNPDVSFLGAGAFLYLDKEFQVISIKSVRYDVAKDHPAGTLMFAKPRRLSVEVAENFSRQRRFHPITLRSHMNAGASDFMWIGPTEVAEGMLGATPGEPECTSAEHGGFAYFGRHI